MGLPSLLLNPQVRFAFSVGGIYLFYMLFSIVHERIVKMPYGPNGDRFHGTFFLLAMTCLGNALTAVMMQVIDHFMAIASQPEIKRQPLMKQLLTRFGDQTPYHTYFIVAVPYILATVCSNFALQYVDYPTQVGTEFGPQLPRSS